MESGEITFGGDPRFERVKQIADTLWAHGYTSYLVGGAVRAALRGEKPKDYDLATSARPEALLSIFPQAVDDGAEFGRVHIGGVDVVTLRSDGVYQDAHRPSSVTFTDDIEEDLARRDFTVNAMALDMRALSLDRLIDPHGGRKDLGAVLRAVGDPEQRIHEDPLRMLRAFRLLGELNCVFDLPLANAIRHNAPRLQLLSVERIRDELSRILCGRWPRILLGDLQEIGLLRYVAPELLPMVNCLQNTPHHKLDVWNHTLAVVQAIEPTLERRLAALFHDCGKPVSKATREDGRDTFHRHEQFGADITSAALTRLRYPTVTVTRVSFLVREHMFNFGPEMRPAAIRRWLSRVGTECVPDLMALRRADRVGHDDLKGYGRQASALVKVMADIEAESHALSLKTLAVNGHDIIALGVKPGPEVGRLLRTCLDAVIEDPLLNDRATLLALAGRELDA